MPAMAPLRRKSLALPMALLFVAFVMMMPHLGFHVMAHVRNV